MKKYHVITDDHFFDRFKNAALRLRDMRGMFQNDGVIITQEEGLEYVDLWNDLMNEIMKLRKDCYSRFKEIKPNENA